MKPPDSKPDTGPASIVGAYQKPCMAWVVVLINSMHFLRASSGPDTLRSVSNNLSQYWPPRFVSGVFPISEWRVILHGYFFIIFCIYSRPLAVAAAKIAFFARLCQTNCKTFLKLAEFPDFLADKIVFRDLGRLC